VKRCIAEGIAIEDLSEKEFLTYLDTGKYPPPDLIVRTGGNIRHSGYFLYQSAYSEYYFTDILWPEFDRQAYNDAITYFDTVHRNF
jgi:undecaprenyl diphosphate synthase